MSKLDFLQGKALELAGQIGDGVRNAVPSDAGKWLQAGAVLGAARAGARAAGKAARRSPGVATSVALAAVGAAGLLVYLASRRRKANGEAAVIDGKARRVEARRAPRKARKSSTANSTTTRTHKDGDGS